MSMSVTLEYCVCFGRGDYGPTIEWEEDLNKTEEKLYWKAEKLRTPLNDVPGLRKVLNRAYRKIYAYEKSNLADYDITGFELNVFFPDTTDYDELTKEEAAETLKEMLVKIKKHYDALEENRDILQSYINDAGDYFEEDEELEDFAKKLAEEMGIPSKVITEE